MTNHWLTEPRATSEPPKHQLHPIPGRLITDRFDPEHKEKMIADIEGRVMDWLKSWEGDEILEFHFTGAGAEILLFSRAEINIKTCANCWAVWRIAEANNWHQILSHKVHEVCMNDYTDDVVLPNEIRCQSYSKQE